MTEHDDDLERDDLLARLTDERPVPRPAFRGDLGRAIATQSRRLKPQRRWAAGLLATGVVCLAIPAIGVAGAGPFAAPDQPVSGGQATAQVR
jgi:hypothetical protein